MSTATEVSAILALLEEGEQAHGNRCQLLADALLGLAHADHVRGSAHEDLVLQALMPASWQRDEGNTRALYEHVRVYAAALRGGHFHREQEQRYRGSAEAAALNAAFYELAGHMPASSSWGDIDPSTGVPVEENQPEGN